MLAHFHCRIYIHQLFELKHHYNHYVLLNYHSYCLLSLKISLLHRLQPQTLPNEAPQIG